MKKQIILLSIPLISFFLLGCSVNTVADKPEEANTVLTTTPKRLVSGDTYNIYNSNSVYPLQVWQNGYLVDDFTGTYIGTYVSTTPPTIMYEDGCQFLVGSMFGDSSYSSEEVTSFTISSDLEYTDFYITRTTLPDEVQTEITIINEFPSGTNAYITALDDNLDYILRVAPQTSQTFILQDLFENDLGDLDYIDLFASTNDYLNVGTTSGDDDLLSNERRYHLYETETNTNLYFSIGGDYLLLINESYQDFNYYQGAVDYSTSIYYTIEAGETITITPEMQTTVWGSIPFQIEYNGLQIISLYSNQIDSIFYHKYYLTFSDPIYNMTINLEGELIDTPESILSNTFTTIASSLESLIPILNLSVFGNVTIGFLLLIPFTYALIRLIMRLIKK